MKQENSQKNKPNNGSGGSKFLPGGGKGSVQNQHVQNQTARKMHTNQSHIGGAHGGK
jgi:hypothetical protein